VSFADDETRTVFEGRRSRKLPSDIQGNAGRKLGCVDAANIVFDLRQPPSNHLERLKGNREGQWSIRINDQWRVCFRWIERRPIPGSDRPQPGDAYDVEITNHYS
jgi:proteic killer suppression protein